ncbi:MAG: hypothetical protein U0840_14770 [Gemmataceae bacterium]
MERATSGLRALIEELLSRDRFAGTLPLAACLHGIETERWEIFQGRLVDPRHTRQECTLESWSIYTGEADQPAPAPILSVKLDLAAGLLHVVRGVESWVHTTLDGAEGIVTREEIGWVQELVETIDLAHVHDLHGELESAISRSMTGTRLPLSAVEAPHPAFSFGLLWYRTPSPEPWRALEFALRSGSTLEAVEHWSAAGASQVLAVLRQLFLHVSLSPWTDFCHQVLLLLASLEQRSVLAPASILDFESWLLRLLVRHLTAYDLVTFHHRGANYPDALLLDAILTDYLAHLERHPDLFIGGPGRIRRRALRQAYVARRRYEGHPVPDVPTSPGEALRVFPGQRGRISETQLLHPGKRQRRLFADDPLRLTSTARALLEESLADLDQPQELRELGAAVFLDRPFGAGTGARTVDRTPALSSLASSDSIARERLEMLNREFPGAVPLDLPWSTAFKGLPLSAVGEAVRPATVSLADAARAAPDFVFHRTLPGSLAKLARLFRWEALEPVFARVHLMARAAETREVVCYNADLQPLLTCEPRPEGGFLSCQGIDLPAAGLWVHQPGGPDAVVLPRFEETPSTRECAPV